MVRIIDVQQTNSITYRGHSWLGSFAYFTNATIVTTESMKAGYIVLCSLIVASFEESGLMAMSYLHKL